jgi:DNA-directed RNA polymerase subunit RPC12/RpoP
LQDKKLPITCPICGKKNEFPLEILKEGAPFQCPRCQVKLTLQGHMWEEVQSGIAKMKQED